MEETAASTDSINFSKSEMKNIANILAMKAEESEGAVSEIQEVTGIIVDVVGDLSNSSKDLLEFIENNVMKDYKTLVETSKQYNDDAEGTQNIADKSGLLVEKNFEIE